MHALNTRPDLRASCVFDSIFIPNGEAVPHKEQTRLYFYSQGFPKMGWVSVIRNVRCSLTDVYVYVTQWFNHLCIIPCFLVFSKVVAIFSKRLPTCLTWSCKKYMKSTKCKISQTVHVTHDLSTAENTWTIHNVKSPILYTSNIMSLRQLKIHE